jgi:hypothetical protein
MMYTCRYHRYVHHFNVTYHQDWMRYVWKRPGSSSHYHFLRWPWSLGGGRDILIEFHVGPAAIRYYWISKLLPVDNPGKFLGHFTWFDGRGHFVHYKWEADAILKPCRCCCGASRHYINNCLYDCTLSWLIRTLTTKNHGDLRNAPIARNPVSAISARVERESGLCSTRLDPIHLRWLCINLSTEIHVLLPGSWWVNR